MVGIEVTEGDGSEYAAMTKRCGGSVAPRYLNGHAPSNKPKRSRVGKR